MNPEPIDVPLPRPKPPPEAESVIVTTAGPALAAIWTIGWLALPLVVGTIVLVLVSWAGGVVGATDAWGRVSSIRPNVPAAARAAERTAVAAIEPRPAPPPAGRAGAGGWLGRTGSGAANAGCGARGSGNPGGDTWLAGSTGVQLGQAYSVVSSRAVELTVELGVGSGVAAGSPVVPPVPSGSPGKVMS